MAVPASPAILAHDPWCPFCTLTEDEITELILKTFIMPDLPIIKEVKKEEEDTTTTTTAYIVHKMPYIRIKRPPYMCKRCSVPKKGHKCPKYLYAWYTTEEKRIGVKK